MMEEKEVVHLEMRTRGGRVWMRMRRMREEKKG